MADDPSFLGRGWGFPPVFSRALHDVELVSGVEDVVQSLRILFGTRVGERVMRPDYGCDLEPLMFHGMDATLAGEIEARIRRAVLLWEPRIDLLDVRVGIETEGAGHVDITLDFELRSTNARSNLVFPFYTSEASLSGFAP